MYNRRPTSDRNVVAFQQDVETISSMLSTALSICGVDCPYKRAGAKRLYVEKRQWGILPYQAFVASAALYGADTVLVKPTDLVYLEEIEARIYKISESEEANPIPTSS